MRVAVAVGAGSSVGASVGAAVAARTAGSVAADAAGEPQAANRDSVNIMAIILFCVIASLSQVNEAMLNISLLLEFIFRKFLDI